MSASQGISGSSVCVRNFRVSHELPEDNQVAFFDDQQSELVVVNALGGAVWELLDGKLSVDEISSILAEEVPGAPAQAEVQQLVLAFLTTLLERDAISIVGPA